MEIPGKAQKETSMNISTTLGVKSDEVMNQEGKYYYKSDHIKHYYIQRPEEVDELYNEGTIPTLRNLINTCYQPGYSISLEDDVNNLVYSESEQKYVSSLFHKGDWVEYRGNDMKWELEQVTLVVLQASDDWDYVASKGEDPPLEEMQVFYNLGIKGLVPEGEVRAPEKGLKEIFGCRPFLWQQHCLLQLERRLRFQKDHEHDFQEVDNLLFAENRFEEWLNAPGNEDFNEHYRTQPVITQRLLRLHLLSPFSLLDEITEDKDAWDFEDKDITIYTYYGVLGSGTLTVLLTVLIQILAIAVLLINSTREYNGEANRRFFIQDDGKVEGIYIFGLVPETNFTTFCNNNGSPEGKILIAVVMLMYFIQVIPDTWRQFYKVSGASDTTYSKLNSLRAIVWDSNKDTITQQVGFKLDRYMNIGFTCLVYWSMLFLLFNTPHVLDIILNALAIEFIHQFDERLADSEWWDPQNRYIMAGAQEIVLRTYDIDPAEYELAVGSISNSLYNPVQGARDDSNPDFMSKNERLWDLFAKHARDTNNRRALEHFSHIPRHYGSIEAILFRLGLIDSGIFQRYRSYRVWSRWEKILYLPKIPDPPGKEDFNQSVNFADKSLCGFGNKVKQKSNFYVFFLHVLSVLTFRDGLVSVASVLKHGSFLQVPWRILDSVLQFISYLLQVLFPVYVLTGLSLVPYCY